MATFDAILVAIVVGSVGFFLIILNRIFAYNKVYKFPETKYTKLFGFLTKEHILFLYLLAVVLHVLLGIWFLMQL